eukprot:scaffold3968_cov359-Prasinococcus_capsulatus_cf.AAC.2
MGGKLKAKKKSPGARSKSSGSTTSKASAAATAASDPAVRVPSDVKPNNTVRKGPCAPVGCLAADVPPATLGPRRCAHFCARMP